MATDTIVRAPVSAFNRRYRRSEEVPRALGYQCSHIQTMLDLDAIVVADQTGDRWVGAGDQLLCRLLSRSAGSLASGPSEDSMYRIKVLQAVREDLEPSQVTTYAIRLPEQERFVFLAGVGASGGRSAGVARAGSGVRRILGVRPPRPAPQRVDGESFLNELTRAAWSGVMQSVGIQPSPHRGLFGHDDRCYRDVLAAITAPAMDTLVRSGVVVEDPWRGGRIASRERGVGDGVHLRVLRAPMREPRTGVRLGHIEIAFSHRHDTFSLPEPPSLRTIWTH